MALKTHFYPLMLLFTCTTASGMEARDKELTENFCSSSSIATSAGGELIDKIWSGVNTEIGAATDRDGNLFTSYYNSQRLLTVTMLDKKAGTLCRIVLNSRFEGWDAHNSLQLAISNDGLIHVAGNMHASPLVYAQGKSNDVASLSIMPMTGRDEQHATYPKFLFDGARNLLFIYRDGASGAGRWLANRWNGKSWDRLGELFANHDAKGHVSAYPGEFVRDQSGRYHVAVVWRRTKDVSSNFAITYASTFDFLTWDIGQGRTVTGPLTPTSMEIIAIPGEGAGLVNNVKVALSASDKPVVLYTRYGESGLNTIFAATRSNTEWLSKPIATAKFRKEIIGGGSLAGLPTGTFGNNRSSGIEVNIAFGAGDTQHLLFNPDTFAISTFKPVPDEQAKGAVTFLKEQTKGMDDVGTPSTIVRRNGVDGPIAGYLRWFAQKANADRPRACTPDAPAACDPPPAPLLWFPRSTDLKPLS